MSRGDGPRFFLGAAMNGFEPSLLDKLFLPDGGASNPVMRRMSIDDVKESVAVDLESLLNSRAMRRDDELAAFPHCQRSIVAYGLRDFAGMSLASSYDRATICRAIENAIACHESRLKNVRVTLDVDDRATNVLHFSISAMLVVHPAREPVSFDALLQPATLRYAVSRSRRAVI